jgi:hypothetical protein
VVVQVGLQIRSAQRAIWRVPQWFHRTLTSAIAPLAVPRHQPRACRRRASCWIAAGTPGRRLHAGEDGIRITIPAPRVSLEELRRVTSSSRLWPVLAVLSVHSASQGVNDVHKKDLRKSGSIQAAQHRPEIANLFQSYQCRLPARDGVLPHPRPHRPRAETPEQPERHDQRRPTWGRGSTTHLGPQRRPFRPVYGGQTSRVQC